MRPGLHLPFGAFPGIAFSYLECVGSWNWSRMAAARFPSKFLVHFGERMFIRHLLLPCVIALALPQMILAQSALHSIEVVDLDRKAAPCDDFYEFANGTWRVNNPIPASM